MTSNWKQASQKLSDLTIIKLTRKSAVETLYDLALTLNYHDEHLLEDVDFWTGSTSSDGRLVIVGSFDANGVSVIDWLPGHSRGHIGVSFSCSL